MNNLIKIHHNINEINKNVYNKYNKLYLYCLVGRKILREESEVKINTMYNEMINLIEAKKTLELLFK
jgi:hypothetical protein